MVLGGWPPPQAADHEGICRIFPLCVQKLCLSPQGKRLGQAPSKDRGRLCLCRRGQEQSPPNSQEQQYVHIPAQSPCHNPGRHGHHWYLSEYFHKAKKDFYQQGIEIYGIKLNI